MNQRMPFPMQPGQAQWSWGSDRGGVDSLEWVIFALLLVLIVLVVAQIALTLMRRGRHRGPLHLQGGMHGPPDPLSIARLRYARGEIGRDEYVQLTQDLGGEPEAEPLTPPA